MIKFIFKQKSPFPCHMASEFTGSGVTAIFAPSGDGKTTLLRFFAGLYGKQSGQYLSVNGHVWQNDEQFMPTHKRNVACVFQHQNLLAHLSVDKNLSYAKKYRSDALHSSLHQEIISIFNIDPLIKKYVYQLSGGEQQRVALARALIQQPDWLLLDEPLTGIDVVHKKILLSYIKSYAAKQKIPVLYISHHMDEVIQLADYLVLLKKGEIVEQGSVVDVINQHHPFDSETSGIYQLIEARVVSADNLLTVVQSGDLLLKMPGKMLNESDQIRLKINAKDVSISLVANRSTSILNIIECTIESIDSDSESSQCLLTLNAFGHKIYSQLSEYSCKNLNLTCGLTVFAQIKAMALVN